MTVPKGCEEFRENLRKSQANLDESAKTMRKVEEEFTAVDAKVDRHLKRLGDGEDELTPPPFMLPISHAAKK